MIRRISTKFVLAVLAAVVVPFVGFSWYVHGQLATRLSGDIVRHFLLTRAADLVDRIQDELAERRLDVELWASDPMISAAIRGASEDSLERVQAGFDRFVRRSDSFDLFVLVDADGRYLASNGVDCHAFELAPEILAIIQDWAYDGEQWFRNARSGETAMVDQHISPLLHRDPRELHEFPPKGEPEPGDYAMGIAVPVFAPEDAEQAGRPIGVIYGLLNWSVIQSILDASRPEYPAGLIGKELYSSSYAWLWKSDGNTIIGHQDRTLYWEKVNGTRVNLPQLVAAVNADDWEMYPEYEFARERKHAAFKHCAGPEDGGLGWVVGIGIDNKDIYSTVNELNDLLINATALSLLVVVLWTVFIARHTTRPILELQRHTQRVADGDLEAKIEVTSRDELGELARAFNRMTGELAESRVRLVQAEKEAAWREMARQIAHEIKNPLTPISLSVNLVRRARDEGSEDFDMILDRTIDLIQRQVENMRQIAQNFYAFAGEHVSRPTRVDLQELVQEVLELNAAWASELGVETRVEGEAHEIRIDETELRRVLINLVSNALDAMPEGGKLEVKFAETAESVRIELRDTGSGITDEVRERLFEPYFTTRSSGTGLGLAICKRVIDEMGGEIHLEPAPLESGGGTLVTVILARVPAGGSSEPNLNG